VAGRDREGRDTEDLRGVPARTGTVIAFHLGSVLQRVDNALLYKHYSAMVDPTWQAAFTWAVSQEVTGVLQWIGTIIAVIGVPISIIKAAQAASAAGEARAAVLAFSKRLGLANTAHSLSQVDTLRQFVSSTNYAAAMIVATGIKRSIFHLVDNMSVEHIEQGKRNIATIEKQLSYANRNAAQFKRARLDAAINGLSDVLLDWERRFVQDYRGES
jgi:hypothetical protein